MITDLFFSFIIILFIIFGFSRPHVALVAVIWIDIVKPQNTSFSFLSGTPLSFILTLFFFISFVINIKKIKAPKSVLYHFLMIGFMIWITISSYLGEYQALLWVKYDIAIKTIFFAYFIPYVIYKRSQIEMFLLICVASFGLFVMMAGVKTVLGGGGYGVALVGGNSFLYSEGSTLSTLAVCLIPLFYFLSSKSKLAASNNIFKYLLFGYSLCSILTVIGTQARTGLIALAVYAILLLYRSKLSFRSIVLVSFIPMLVYAFAPQEWFERMSTIEQSTTSEKSAVGRLVVWRWTIDYAAENPFFGGGFYAHLANAGQLQQYQKGNEDIINQKGGKAFHNILFEVLGETGFGGLFIFLGIIMHSLLVNRLIYKNSKKDIWKNNLSIALNHSMLIYCAGGMFIGVAFYPWLYYLYAASISSMAIELEVN
jgi:probable O-glycosylation ligase (exosortase A-associated)